MTRSAAARNLVRQRASERCEYCRLPENVVQIPFHVEHVIAKQHGGSDDPANLCLACDRCNLYKGP
ncbi:MAG: HNH endonuclease, partial [Gammaproteobacteria bacterium]